MMERGPKPASPLPWEADIDDGREWTGKIYLGDGNVWLTWCGHGMSPSELDPLVEVANLAAIVHRVNGWDALCDEVERLALELDRQRYACEQVGKERGKLRESLRQQVYNASDCSWCDANEQDNRKRHPEMFDDEA
jgi:hypothetical protein